MTSSQESELREKIVDPDAIVNWIRDNVSIEEVFDDEQIKEYARKTFLPGSVFDDDELGDWAKANGFVEA